MMLTGTYSKQHGKTSNTLTHLFFVFLHWYTVLIPFNNYNSG